MPVEMTPITGGAGDNGAYLAVGEAISLATPWAAVVPGMSAFLAKDSATQAAVLLWASLDIDGQKYQGCKFDPPPGIANDGGQVREFPRLPDGLMGAWRNGGGLGMWPGYYWGSAVGMSTGGEIWDWDPTANDGQGAAVVPLTVKQACIFQAAWRCLPKYAKRLEAIKSGLVQQSIGTASETLGAGTPSQGGGGMAMDGLCADASRLLADYLLKSGRIL
jgi:hypothetical protein